VYRWHDVYFAADELDLFCFENFLPILRIKQERFAQEQTLLAKVSELSLVGLVMFQIFGQSEAVYLLGVCAKPGFVSGQWEMACDELEAWSDSIGRNLK
jgi:hypothetical protein